MPGPSVRKDRLAGSRVVPDVQPFSSGQRQDLRWPNHYGEECFETEEFKAYAIVDEELRRRWKKRKLKE